MASRLKANPWKKVSFPKKKDRKSLKRRAPKIKVSNGGDGHRLMDSLADDKLVDNSREFNEKDLLNEAKKTWPLGKQLGLFAEDEDAVIAALAGGFDVDKSKPMQHKRKKHKGKKRKE